MDRSQLIDVALCVAFGGLFSVCHALASNKVTGLKGKDLIQLVLLSCFMGLVAGAVIVPVSEVAHMIVQTPDVRDRSARVLAAAFLGWIGLEEAFKRVDFYLDKYLQKKTGETGHGDVAAETAGSGAADPISLDGP